MHVFIDCFSSPHASLTKMSAERYNSGAPQEELASYFDKSASAVQAYADRIEHLYARPALKTSQAFFNEHPITTIFLVISSLLSFLPVALFIGFSLFAIITFTIIALCCSFLASTAVVIALLTFLIFALIAILFTSAFLTVFLISFYIFARLVILVRASGRAGVSEWAAETKRRILHTTSTVYRKVDDAKSKPTPGPVAVVAQENEPKTPKSEPPSDENSWIDEDEKSGS